MLLKYFRHKAVSVQRVRSQDQSATMIPRVLIIFLLILPFFFTLSLQAKNVDPYKVLGVDRSANQREIQKAFHKLSLKYHPDKNKNKGAQEKFSEINNAYEILSDEDKRKNYDLSGDARRSTGLNEDNFGNPEGYTYFTGGPGGPGGGGPFTVGSHGWKKMSGQGNFKSFSSFGGEPGSFDVGDIFSNFFRTSGNVRGNHHGGGVSSSGPRSNLNYPASGIIQNIGSQSFKEKVRDQGITWLLLFYAPSTGGYDVHESLIEDVATSLHGALKAGKVNCQSEWALCRDLGISPSRSALLFIYAYGSSGKDSLLEYNDDFDAKSLKTFCLDHLPRISKRADISNFEFPDTNENLPQVLLLSTKKDTPAMWRVLSGLCQKRFAFYDAEVRDVSDPPLKKYGIEALPALVGRMSNGDVHVLKAGIAVKDLQSGVNELKYLLESFERKNTATSPPSKKAESRGKNVPLLTALNADSLCGKSTPLCIIGVFRSEKARRKLENLLLALSRKTLVRKQSGGADCGDSISYVLLNALKQSQALNSFDWSGFRNLDKLLLAYKPRKGKFVIFTGEHTLEEVEKFIGSVLNGDVVFSKTRYNPDFS